MCGLVGVAARYSNGLTNKEADLFTHMLFVDTLRGWDSTGVFSVNERGNVDIKKAALTGPNFIQTEEYKSFMRDSVRNGVFVCGHNRAATRGSITDKNAHPFYVNDKIILMQNGTMYGDHKKHKDVEVDSEAIAHVLAEEEDIEKALQKINAAYALVWYNTDKEELYILRNDDRPLYISYFNDRGMVWASEKETILWAASRCDIKLNQEPYLLKDHHMITLRLGENGRYLHTTKDVNTKYVAPPGFHAETDEYAFSSLVHYAARGHYDHSSKQYPSLPFTPNQTANVTPINKPRVRSFGDILGTDPHLAQYLFDDMLSATRACRQILQERNNQLRIVVEPLDFVPADNSTNPKNWYLFGSILSPNTVANTPTPLIHWYVANKTIEEMLELSTKYFYTVEVRTHVTSCLSHKNAVSAMFYGHSPEPFIMNNLIDPNTAH